jgi:hypothetical protein
MELVLALAVCTAANVASFIVGAKVGQKVSRGEAIETPTVSPAKLAQERRNRKQAQEEQDKLDTILRNIEGYDGTGRGQKDVPGR